MAERSVSTITSTWRLYAIYDAMRQVSLFESVQSCNRLLRHNKLILLSIRPTSYEQKPSQSELSIIAAPASPWGPSNPTAHHLVTLTQLKLVLKLVLSQADAHTSRNLLTLNYFAGLLHFPTQLPMLSYGLFSRYRWAMRLFTILAITFLAQSCSSGTVKTEQKAADNESEGAASDEDTSSTTQPDAGSEPIVDSPDNSNSTNDAAALILGVSNKTITEGDSAPTIALTVPEPGQVTACSSLLSATSSNTSLLPNANIVVTGTAPNCNLTMNPVDGESGAADITLIYSDGTVVEQEVFSILVAPANQPPTIGNVADQNIVQDSDTGALAIVINDPDQTLDCASHLSGSSSNTALVPNANIDFAGTAPNCAVTVTPTAGQTGSAIITLNVSDGALSTQDTFTLTVISAVVTSFTDTDNSGTGFAGKVSSSVVVVNGSDVSFAAWTVAQRELPKNEANDTFINMANNVLLFDFDGSGSVTTAVTDVSGNENHFGIDGANNSFATGILDQALSYDRTDGDMVEWTTALSPDFPGAQGSATTDFTIMGWYKFAMDSVDHFLFHKCCTDSSFNFSVSSSNRLNLEVWKNNATSTNFTSSIAVVTANAWVHLAATYDYVADGSSVIKLFANGRKIAEKTDAVGPMQSTTGGIYVRPWWSSGITLMDEFAVFKEALSEATITHVFERQRPAVVYFGNSSGTLTSRVMDSNKPAGINWDSFSFRGAAPYGKELLPGSPESVYSQNNAGTALYTDLKAYWRLNGTAGAAISNGSTIPDASGNNHPLIVVNGGNTGVGLEYTTSRLKTGVTFDGGEQTDWLEAADHADFTFDSSLKYTWMFWFSKEYILNGEWESLFGMTDGTSNYVVFYPADVNGYVNKGVGAFIAIAGGGGLDCKTPPNVITIDQLYHLVISYDGSIGNAEDRIKIYLNGLDTGASCQEAGVFTGVMNPADIQLGNSGAWDEAYAGFIDEVAIWHRTLSAVEALQLYQRGSSHIKFQIRACTDADCGDGTFVGPDGTAATHFSEVDNSTAGFPSFDLPNFGLKRYFQYQANFVNLDPSIQITLEQVSVLGSE